jgi:hypothetical protein
MKTRIITFASILLFFILCGISAVKLKDYIGAKITAVTHVPKQTIPSDITPPATPSGILDILTPTDIPIDTSSVDFIPTATPYPITTLAPLPIITPAPVTSAPYSCAGTPTVDNSQIYVSSSTTQVNSTSTISVELSDCNNSIAPVSDSLTITLVSGDAGTKINGASAPVTFTTQNGKVSFSVTSPNATTATFLVTDTTRSFAVTTPGYHNPSVTFTNNSSGNANCTTANGIPNTWYSDVYPNPPVSTSNGSITIIVDLRDCNQKLAPVSDVLNISVSSGNSDTQMNNGSLPQNVTTQNGEAKFTLSSQMNGTVTLSVQDTTSGFNVTDPNNHNPTITFTNANPSTPTPTDTPTPTPGSTDTPTPTPVSTDTPTPSGTPQ